MLQVPGFDDWDFLEILRFVLWAFFSPSVMELWDPWSWTTQTSFRGRMDWIQTFFNFRSISAPRPYLPSTAPQWQHGWGIKANVSLRQGTPALAVEAFKQLDQILSCVVILVAHTQTSHSSVFGSQWYHRMMVLPSFPGFPFSPLSCKNSPQYNLWTSNYTLTSQSKEPNLTNVNSKM